MKKEYLINFNLFSKRRKFNLEDWIKNSEDNSYEALSKTLIKHNVCPPSEDFFISVKFKVFPPAVAKPKAQNSTEKKPSRRKRKNEKDSV